MKAGIRFRPARRRGLALLTMLIALLAAAFVMDRLATGFERDHSDATAAAVFRQIRMIADSASVTGADPVANGSLPHVTVRREIEYEYRAVANGDDVLVFSWQSLPPGTAIALGNRVGEWLSRDRVASPLVLPLGEIPESRPELVRRDMPDMHADLGASRLLQVGPVTAVSGRWAGARTDSAAGFQKAVAGEAVIQGDATGRIASITEQIGDAGTPVTMAITVPSGSPTPGPGTLHAEQLDLLLTLAADTLDGEQVAVENSLEARILVSLADEVTDLSPATIEDVVAGSVRVHGRVSAGHLSVEQECVGCAP